MTNHKISVSEALLLIIGIFLFSISCDYDTQVVDADLIYVLKISDCDSLRNDTIFQKHNEIRWTTTKPKSVVEAVMLLDSMTNDYTRHLFKICDPNDFHLGFGMGIRNEWVYSGEDAFNEQLFKRLKLPHNDLSSALVLKLYELYLTQDTIKIMELLGEGMNADSMKTAREEFKKIENELNKIKHSR